MTPSGIVVLLERSARLLNLHGEGVDDRLVSKRVPLGEMNLRRAASGPHIPPERSNRQGACIGIAACAPGRVAASNSAHAPPLENPAAQNEKSRRAIPLGPRAIAWLQQHRLRAKRTAADDLVFGSRSGQPMRESKLFPKVLQPAAEGVGLGRVTWHQFRPHSLGAAQRCARARQDRTGAARTFKHLDDTQHLHKRRRRLAPHGDRGARARIVPKCSQIAGCRHIGEFGKS